MVKKKKKLSISEGYCVLGAVLDALYALPILIFITTLSRSVT